MGCGPGVASLPLIGIMFGEFIGCAIVISMEPYYGRQVKRNGGRPVPEARLPAMIIGAAAFPIGLFWFAWAGNYPDRVHWIVPTLSGLFIGTGLITIFLQSFSEFPFSKLKF